MFLLEVFENASRTSETVYSQAIDKWIHKPLPQQGLVVYFLSLHARQLQFFADPADQPR